MTRLVEYADRNAKLDDVLKGESLPERPGAIQSLESIGRDIEQAAAPFPGEFGRAFRESVPIAQAVELLKDQLEFVHRPFIEAFRELLAKFHEAKKLGTFEENFKATDEINQIAKACGVEFFYEDQRVLLTFQLRSGTNSGIFRLRTTAGEALYQRIDFPPLDVRARAESPSGQNQEVDAGRGDVSQAVSDLSEQFDVARRPFVDELRGLLTRLHEAKNLGSFEENARAAREVYTLAKSCEMNLIYEGQPVALLCYKHSGVKAGLFRVRTLDSEQRTLYQRVAFPALDIAPVVE